MSKQEQEKIHSLVRDVNHAAMRLSEALILETNTDPQRRNSKTI